MSKKVKVKKTGLPAVMRSPSRLKKWQSNPGLRSKLPDSALTTEQRASRKLNRRLDSPVLPGSTLTNRDVARQGKNYIKLKYGAGDVAEAQGIATQGTLNRDQQDWYDAYNASLRQHATNVNGIADQAVQNVAGVGNGLRSAAGQVLGHQADPQSQATNALAQAVRDDRAGSWVGQLASQGAATKRYASTLANVVGPGQKLQAMAQGQRKLSKLQEDARTRKDTKAADEANFRSGLVADESKSLTALAIAQGKANTSVTTAKIRAAAGNSTVNKYGYTNAEWKKMSTAERRAAIQAYTRDTTRPRSGGVGNDQKMAPDGIHTMADWLAATPAQRKKWKREASAKGGPSKTDATAQKRFAGAYAQFSSSTVDGKPMSAAYVRKNANMLVNTLQAKTRISRKMALRVLSAYIKNNGKDPGSFKDYGKPGAPAVPIK